MRTTLDIGDAVLDRARRLFLSQRPERAKPLETRWIVVAGRQLPDVDVADRDRLYDALDGRV